MAAYEAFADLYDALMYDVDYDTWARYYLELIEKEGISGGSLCDCACGTGSMSVRFAAKGWKVTGVDFSTAMLEKAQSKARCFGVKAMFVCQDMCALKLPKPVDVIVCACDGVNYLLDDEHLTAFFGHVHAALRPRGILAFDISSAWKIKNQLGNQFLGEDRDEVTYLWDNSYNADNQTVTMDLTFFVRRDDGLYRRFDEEHIQKAHEPDHLCHLLKQSGFEKIKIFGDQTFLPPEEDTPRIHIVALRS